MNEAKYLYTSVKTVCFSLSITDYSTDWHQWSNHTPCGLHLVHLCFHLVTLQYSSRSASRHAFRPTQMTFFSCSEVGSFTVGWNLYFGSQNIFNKWMTKSRCSLIQFNLKQNTFSLTYWLYCHWKKCFIKPCKE